MNIIQVFTLRQRPKVFYGWFIVFVAFLVSMTHDVAHGQVLAVFIKPMSEEFGWGRTVMSGAYSLAFVLGGFLSALVGPMVDRRGPRLITTLSLVLIVLATAALSTVGTLWQFYLFFILSRLMSGVASMGTQVAVVNWFIRMRGRAIAFSNMGMRAGLVFMPLALQVVVVTHGWRWGWIVLGVGVTALVMLPSALLLRRRPEDMGLRPDGDSAERCSYADPPARGRGSFRKAATGPDPVWSLSQAVRTPAFWLLNFSQSFFVMLAAGVALHQVAYLTDVGIAPTAAVTVLSFQAASAIAGNLAFGFVVERLPARYGLILVYAGLAASVLFLIVTDTLPEAYIFAFFFGFFSGGATTMMSTIWPDYYGRASIGSIRGIGSIPSNIASAFGPLLAGIIFDATGKYTISFAFFGFVMALAALLMVVARAPKPQAAPVGGLVP